jgi:hypothetical protein
LEAFAAGFLAGFLAAIIWVCVREKSDGSRGVRKGRWNRIQRRAVNGGGALQEAKGGAAGWLIGAMQNRH